MQLNLQSEVISDEIDKKNFITSDKINAVKRKINNIYIITFPYNECKAP